MAFYLYSVLVMAIVAACVNNCSAITEEQKEFIKEKLKANALACGSELGFAKEQLTQWKEQKTSDDSNKCFIACMFKKSGLLDDQGLYSEEKALEKVKTYVSEARQEELAKAAKTCSAVNEQSVSDGSAGCDRALLLFKCIQEQKELLGITLDFVH
uniref:Odorant binding protein 1 n=1 Tax=Grapholita molesta TaxID=192188 RepID=A0A0N9XPP0_GRAMO|nr:odorant binding protein 1 [Grapholita molesta]